MGKLDENINKPIRKQKIATEIDPEYEEMFKNLKINRVGKENGKNMVPEKGVI